MMRTTPKPSDSLSVSMDLKRRQLTLFIQGKLPLVVFLVCLAVVTVGALMRW